MKTVVLALHPKRLKKNGFLTQMTYAMKQAFEELGFVVTIKSHKDGGRVDVACSMWDARISMRRFKCKNLIHISSEQLPYYVDVPDRMKKWWDKTESSLGKYDCILDYSTTQVQFLKQLGHKAVLLAWGYSPYFDQTQDVRTSPYKNDIVFIGGLQQRRLDVFREIGMPIIKINGVHKDQGIWIRDAAINLNIHIYERASIQSGRLVVLGLGNRGFMISEPYDDHVPLQHKKHLVIVKREEMNDAIKYYLSKPEERFQIAHDGYAFVTQYYTMTQNLHRALMEANII